MEMSQMASNCAETGVMPGNFAGNLALSFFQTVTVGAMQASARFHRSAKQKITNTSPKGELIK
ncbi:hypothetical protein K3553_13750 [Leisingera aquaemixtae]|uniref:hypothetical protein n=1 Tax=Leisingera aquaemixtae TaxID=1396826 RepID=UPI0021A3EE03|nr:hypothetical protein [Leisingera aquaemixtae]UWQ24028.1 hypothetical protein K3553_13750 [Leisingera aquaemixtae]